MQEDLLFQELIKKYPPLLTQSHVHEITGRAHSSLEQDRLYGRGIPFIRMGGRSIRYRLDDVVAWLKALPRFKSTTEADHAA